jgi:polysaccharide biosynthesis transport protein
MISHHPSGPHGVPAPSSPLVAVGASLREYIGVLGRRKWWALAPIALLLSASLGSSFATDEVYEASTTMILADRVAERLFDSAAGTFTDAQRRVENEIQFLESAQVRGLTGEALGRSVPKVDGRQIGQTDAIDVVVRSGDPEFAAEAADAYALAYIEFRRTQAVNDLLAASELVQDQITDLETARDALPTSDTAGRANLQDQITAFQERLNSFQVDASLRAGGAQIAEPAAVPSTPVAPRPVRNAVLALALGALLGIGLAFTVELLDDRLHTRDELSALTQRPVLASIPLVKTLPNDNAGAMVTIGDPASVAAEAYRGLRTSIQFVTLDGPRRLLMTSAMPGDGKSTTTANLGVVFAAIGFRTLLVDADLRRPKLSRLLELESGELPLGDGPGLSTVLLGSHEVDDAIRTVAGVERLDLLPTGTLPPNPSELLSLPAADKLFAELGQRYDLVLVDTAPVLAVTDAQVLATKLDGVMLVVDASRATRTSTAAATGQITSVGARLLGTVWNRATGGMGDGYGYGYGYTEASSKPSRRRRRQRRRA